MMDLYIARHGETEWNRRELLCGRTDLPLSDEGLRQAEALGARLLAEGIRPGRIYVSPLTRAQQTAAAVARYISAPIVVDARLGEQHFGVFEGGFCRAPAYLTCKQNFALRCPGGESTLDVASRIYAFLNELRRASEIQTALLIGHGSAWRVLNTYFEDVRNEDFPLWGMGNAELRRYQIETVRE